MTEGQCALYARVSSESQARDNTIASQVAALRERIAAENFQLEPDHSYVDEGYSGSILSRPALERLRDAVAGGHIERIYVHAPDRLARRYAHQVLLIDEFRRAGAEVVFLNRPIGGTAEDDLLLQVQGVIAEYERAKILERSRRGRRHAAQSGSVSALTGAPFGYRYVSRSEGGGVARFEVVEDEARIVRLIFAWIGLDRMSLREVCRRLQQMGCQTRRGSTFWYASTIRSMLDNPASGARPSGDHTSCRLGRGCGRSVGICSPRRVLLRVFQCRAKSGSRFQFPHSLIRRCSTLSAHSSRRIAGANDIRSSASAGCYKA